MMGNTTIMACFQASTQHWPARTRKNLNPSTQYLKQMCPKLMQYSVATQIASSVSLQYIRIKLIMTISDINVMRVETSKLAPAQIWPTMLKQIPYSLVKTVLRCFMKRCLPKVIAHIDETFSIPFLYQVPKKHSMQCYTKNAALLCFWKIIHKVNSKIWFLNSMVFTQKLCIIMSLLLQISSVFSSKWLVQ
jgi:hypothetical protein